MKVLNLNSKIDPDGHLRLDLPVNLSPGNIEIILVINTIPDIKTQPKKYDFSDLAGKLAWNGDAVSVQRSLRDEMVEITYLILMQLLLYYRGIIIY